jgi:hypothetical protein
MTQRAQSAIQTWPQREWQQPPGRPPDRAPGLLLLRPGGRACLAWVALTGPAPRSALSPNRSSMRMVARAARVVACRTRLASACRALLPWARPRCARPTPAGARSGDSPLLCCSASRASVCSSPSALPAPLAGRGPHGGTLLVTTCTWCHTWHQSRQRMQACSSGNAGCAWLAMPLWHIVGRGCSTGVGKLWK